MNMLNMLTFPVSWLLLILLSSCQVEVEKSPTPPEKPFQSFFKQNPDFHSDGFDFPVGKPEAKGYYNAQPFGKNTHLGDDWNAVTGGNTDLGHPFYAISNGYVSEVADFGGGWGKVIRVIHYHPNLDPPYVESLYAHCEAVLVKKGQGVKKGQKIGTIGNADGKYLAHLHLEIRDSVDLPLGGGYSVDQTGYLDPTAFIKNNRRAP